MNTQELDGLISYPPEEDIYDQWERVYIDVDTLTLEDTLCENSPNVN